MRRSDIKRFIREACGSTDHYVGEELHTHIRDSLSNGGTPIINVSCPDRDGYVVVCDVLDDLSHRDARHNVDMGFEGFFENDFGEDVFFLFSIEDVDPASLEIQSIDDNDLHEEYDDNHLSEGVSLRSLTKEFLLEKIVD